MTMRKRKYGALGALAVLLALFMGAQAHAGTHYINKTITSDISSQAASASDVSTAQKAVYNNEVYYAYDRGSSYTPRYLWTKASISGWDIEVVSGGGVTGSGNNITGNLVVNTGGSVNTSGTVTVGGNTTITGGSVNTGAGSLNTTGLTTIGGGTVFTPVNSGTIIVSGGTTNGNISSTGNTTINNGTVNGTVNSGGTTTINGGTVAGSPATITTANLVINDTAAAGSITDDVSVSGNVYVDNANKVITAGKNVESTANRTGVTWHIDQSNFDNNEFTLHGSTTGNNTIRMSATDITENVKFANESDVSYDGDNSTIEAGRNASYDNSDINVTGNTNTIKVTDNAKFTNGSQVNVTGTGNTLTISGIISAGDKVEFGQNTKVNVSGGSNIVTIGTTGGGDFTEFNNNAEVNINNTLNTVTIGGDAIFRNTASVHIVDSESSNAADPRSTLVIGDNAHFQNEAKYNLDGSYHQLLVKDDVQFTGTSATQNAGITSSGHHNYIRIQDDVKFNANSIIDATGGSNTIEILNRVLFDEDALINAHNGNNDVIIRLSQVDPDIEEAGKRDFNGQIDFTGNDNTLFVGGNTQITDLNNINFNNGNGNTIHYSEYSRYLGDLTTIGNTQTLVIDHHNAYKGWNKYDGADNTLVINMNYVGTDTTTMVGSNIVTSPNKDRYEMTGQVVFDQGGAGSTAPNKIYIMHGTLDNLNGSVIGSDLYESNFTITGGDSLLLVSGAAKSTYTVQIADDGYIMDSGDMYIGNVYNIRAKSDLLPGRQTNPDNTAGAGDYTADYLKKDDIAVDHTIEYVGIRNNYLDANGENRLKEYTTYSLLNMDEVKLTTGAVLHIGSLDSSFNGKNHVDYASATDYGSVGDVTLGNQITANTVTVGGLTKLMIHEDERLNGAAAGWGTTSENRNIVNSMTIQNGGYATIDRTTIYGSDHASGQVANVLVEQGGILQGFGERTANDDHDPLRAQVVGNVEIKGGGIFRAYDSNFFVSHVSSAATELTQHHSIFDIVDEDLRGVVFKVTDDGANGGTLKLNSSAIMQGRLFHYGSYNDTNVTGTVDGEGATYYTQYSDSIMATRIDFANIWNGIETNPDRINQVNKIQYQPVYGFHYDLKSKQEFELYTGDRPADDMTYRFNVVNSDNEIAALYGQTDANYLFNRDILRSDMLGNYMFIGTDDKQSVYLRYRMFTNHPTQGGTRSVITNKNNVKPAQYFDEIRYPFSNWDTDLTHLPVDPTYDPTLVGYQTDPDKHGYNGNMGEWYFANQSYFDNYTADYIADWELLMLGMQRHVGAANEMDAAMTQLNGEQYGSVSEGNFNAMNQFIANRERNSISALFMVEAQDDPEAAASSYAYASLDNCAGQYVANPIRFWASGFGTVGRQKFNPGGAYNYKHETWGGSVGAIKEFGDLYVGATIGHARTKHTWNQLPGSFTGKSYLGEVHAGLRIFNMGFVEVHGNYSYNEQESSRGINYANYYIANFKGDWEDQVFGGGIRLGYQHVMRDKWLFVPTIGLTVMHNRSQAFEETASGPHGLSPRLIFKKGGMDRTVVRVPVTFRLSRSWALGDFMLSPEIRAGFTPIMGQRNGRSVAKWAGNPTNNRWFTTESGGKGAYEAMLGATIELSRKGRFYVAGNYDYNYSPKAFSHNFSIQGGLNF